MRLHFKETSGWVLVLSFILILLFVLNSSVSAQTAIECGQRKDSTISTAGEQHSYTFSANANDAVTIRVITTNQYPILTLKNSAGVTIETSGPRHLFTWIDKVLPSDTYTIVVKFYNNGTGDYTLFWQRLNNNPCNTTPVQCGETANGQISTTKQQNFYTTQLNYGDVVIIRLIVTDGPMDPYLEIYNNSTATRLEPSGVAYIKKTIDTASGQYSIIVSDRVNNKTGEYKLIVQKLKDTVSCMSCHTCDKTPLTKGENLFSQLSNPGDQTFYTITAQADDVVTIRLIDTVDNAYQYPRLEIYDPEGVEILNEYWANEVIFYNFNNPFDRDGVYTIIVSEYGNNDILNYNMTWQNLKNPENTTNLQRGLTVPDYLSEIAEQDYFTFTAHGGDAVTIRLAERSAAYGPMEPKLELYSPGGELLHEEYSYGEFVKIDAVLPGGANGEYTLIVSDLQNNDTGNYFITFQDLKNPENTTDLECGRPMTATISEQGEEDYYTFTAQGGDAVTVRLIAKTDNMKPKLEIYDPEGILLPNGSKTSPDYVTIDQILPLKSGVYTVIVSDDSNHTGDYNIKWQDLKNPCYANNLECGQTVTGFISERGEEDFYKFSANAGDAIAIHNADKGNQPSNAKLELYNPVTATRIGEDYWDVERISATLPAEGIYTIVVRDTWNKYMPHYYLNLEFLNNSCNNARSLQCGQTINGMLKSRDSDVYAITVDPGDDIYLLLTWKQNWPGLFFGGRMELYSLAGDFVAGGPIYSYVASIQTTLSEGGTYILIISKLGLDYTATYSLKFQKNNNSCPEITVTTPNGGEVISDSAFTIGWSSGGTQTISSHEVRLSLDGGATFPISIVTGLPGSAQSHPWSISPDLVTTTGRIRVIARDIAGRTSYDDSDDNFILPEDVSRIGRSYIYDELNRLIKIVYEDNSADIYTYDKAGNLSISRQPPP